MSAANHREASAVDELHPVQIEQKAFIPIAVKRLKDANEFRPGREVQLTDDPDLHAISVVRERDRETARSILHRPLELRHI